MDFLKLCQDYNLPIAPHGHKHHIRGWVNTVCPFCTGNPGYHLGYELSTKGSGFSCLRCGGHGGVSTIARLLRISNTNAASVIENYGGRAYLAQAQKRREWQISTSIAPPLGTTKLATLGRKYLKQRNFDPDEIEKLYHVQETGFVGPYRGRIVIPVMFAGYMISYVCRSYTGSETRYMACPTDKEAIPAKDILYNIDNVPNKQRIVVVEGITDVWRLGDGAVATLGTKVTPSQLNFLIQFARVVLIRDMDNAGSVAFTELQARLRAFRIPTSVIKIDAEDAAALDPREAKYLMKTV